MAQTSRKLTQNSNSNAPTQYAPDSVVVRGADYNKVVSDITELYEISVGDGTLLPGLIACVAQNDIAAGTGGAISVANYLTTINTDAGGDAFTLADGQSGQLKKILLVVDGGGDAVITPANLSGGTTITMDDAADYVILQFNGTDWVVIENSGCTIA